MSELIAPNGRSFRSSVPAADIERLFTASFHLRYRRRPMVKFPFDIALYMQLINNLRPRTVIEVGAFKGGSALWFADLIRHIDKDARVVSVDIEPPTNINDKRITFLQGDSTRLGDVLTPDLLAALPRPWLISEDSAHTYYSCSSVLEFFAPRLEVGEYIVIEDGGAEAIGHRFEGGGANQAVCDFLAREGERYEIDASLCDFFGYNATLNPNGYLRRVK